MNLGFGQYQCDRCGELGQAKRLPFGWHRRGDDHICPTCWSSEPDERVAVLRYGVTHVELPEEFWQQQRAARLLWDGLVEIGQQTLNTVSALRALYAPDAVAAAWVAGLQQHTAWGAVDTARRAWRLAPSGSDDEDVALRDQARAEKKRLHETYVAAKRAAVAAGTELSAAYAEAKRAARAAGCDERPAWVWRDVQIAAAPQWTYESVKVDGRRMVRRCLPGEPAGQGKDWAPGELARHEDTDMRGRRAPGELARPEAPGESKRNRGTVATWDADAQSGGAAATGGVTGEPSQLDGGDERGGGAAATCAVANAWRLQRGLADQICDEYRRAWSAWQSHRHDGRGMPRAHGTGLGDRVRMVARYTNGMSYARLQAGTWLCKLRRFRYDHRAQGQRRGGRFVELRMACGGGTIPTQSRPWRQLTAEVHLHRPIPDGADVIRAVALVGTRFADRWQWSLHVTCRTPAPRREPAPDRAEAVAVDLRWRQDSTDPRYLLVAEWLATDGAWGQVLVDTEQRNRRQSRDRGRRDGPLPSSWRDYLTLQAVMDWCLDGVKAVVWQRSPFHDQPYSETFRLTRSQGLLRAIRNDAFPESADELATWQRWYLTNLRRLARLRQRLIARRDQLYYEQAHAICAHAETIVLEADVRRGSRRNGTTSQVAMDLRPLAESDDAMAGNQRHLLAPGRFRQILIQVAAQYETEVRQPIPLRTAQSAIKQAARRIGVEIALIDKNRTSTTCPSCGAVRPKGGAAEVLTCPNGHRYDQKFGACTELLARWRERRGDGGNGGGTRGTEGAGKTKQSRRSGHEYAQAEVVAVEALADAAKT